MSSQRTNQGPADGVRGILKLAKSRARGMSVGSTRTEIPIRSRFIRDIEATEGATAETPMRRLVAAGSRDGITLRLYLALIWRCSASPFRTDVSAQQWGELLALEEPINTYSRRVSKAIKRLENENLISVKREKGRTSLITLLDESGDGSEYTRPHYGRNPKNRWVKIPVDLWQNDRFYDLGTPGLAMMLALLAEAHRDGSAVWWSPRRFKQRIGLTESTRSRGVKQLVEAGFVTVVREKVPGVRGKFSNEAVRNTYLLHLDGAPRRRKGGFRNKGIGNAVR